VPRTPSVASCLPDRYFKVHRGWVWLRLRLQWLWFLAFGFEQTGTRNACLDEACRKGQFYRAMRCENIVSNAREDLPPSLSPGASHPAPESHLLTSIFTRGTHTLGRTLRRTPPGLYQQEPPRMTDASPRLHPADLVCDSPCPAWSTEDKRTLAEVSVLCNTRLPVALHQKGFDTARPFAAPCLDPPFICSTTGPWATTNKIATKFSVWAKSAEYPLTGYSTLESMWIGDFSICSRT
jgi:hypothetical protein